jgi:hypothetical protein
MTLRGLTLAFTALGALGLNLTCLSAAQAAPQAKAGPKMRIELAGGHKAGPAVPSITGPSARGTRTQTTSSMRLVGDQVYLNIRNADLSTDVLPLFERQLGLRVRYEGVARKVTLRLSRPIPWREALKLVARFSRTHLARDYKGTWTLRPRNGGEAGKKNDDLDGQSPLARERDLADRRVRRARALKASAVRRKARLKREAGSRIENVQLGGFRKATATQPTRRGGVSSRNSRIIGKSQAQRRTTSRPQRQILAKPQRQIQSKPQRRVQRQPQRKVQVKTQRRTKVKNQRQTQRRPQRRLPAKRPIRRR